MASKKSPLKRSHGKAQPKKFEVSGGSGEAATLESHPRRTLLLVLGMHRSGTSAYTNTFALLGAALPRNLMSGRIGNEMGHFESERLYVEHDKMLKEIGSHWYDWNALSEDFFKSTLARTFAARFAEIVREEYGDAELIVVKDPRICRFVPIWRDVATLLDANIKIVTPFRNPMEVASSLRKLHILPIQESLLVWTRHVLEAEFWTRDLPRAFIPYEALLGDWRSVVDQCSKEIGLTFPRRSPKAERQVDIYLDRGLRRNMFGDKEFLSHSNIPDWTQDAYASLKKLQTDSLKQEVLQKLDLVRSDFDRVSSNLASVFAERDQRLFEATDANAQKASEVEQLRAANEVQAAETAAERTGRESAEAAAALHAAEIAGLTEQAATLDGEVQAAQTRLWELEQRLSEALQQRSYLEDELSRAEDNVAAATISAIDQLKQEKATLAATEFKLAEELARAQRAESEQASIAGKLRQKAAEADARADDAGIKVSALEVKTAHLERNIVLHEQEAAALLNSTSWRLSAPWRSYRRMVSRLRRVLRGKKINPLFDREWYLQQYPDVRAGEMDPYEHYLRHGAAEGRDPNALFDTDWYLEQNLDVRQSGANPLVHFYLHGAAEGRDPHPLFSNDWYFQQHPLLQKQGTNALVHYLALLKQE